MEHTVSKEQMEALQRLADTNLKISEAKDAFRKIQEAEEAYLLQRERQGHQIVENIINESREILKEAQRNYTEAHDFHNTVSSFANFIIELSEDIHSFSVDFEQRGRLWDEEVKRKYQEFTDLRNEIKRDRQIIENDRAALERKEKIIKQDRKKLEDERGTLERAIKRLKEGRI